MKYAEKKKIHDIEEALKLADMLSKLLPRFMGSSDIIPELILKPAIIEYYRKQGSKSIEDCIRIREKLNERLKNIKYKTKNIIQEAFCLCVQKYLK